MVLNTETEQRIVASAEKLFYQKGKAGTSMQDIADDAGINRTLLNYYFRSKDQLFEAVFRRAMGRFVPGLAAMLQSEMRFSEYILHLVETIIDTMIEHPQIPIFVLQELTSNPSRMPQIMREMGVDPEKGFQKFTQDAGLHGRLDMRQFILNVLSLCIFPFAARPVVTEILYNGDQEAYLLAMKQRKKLLPELIMKFLNER
ncbi:MAG TPA: TetR/AcrR family transcriptional regulator [Bacteroides sp.]|nr:TetR/AcrR family transcriptional regulator [Bacteroides sp.]